MSKERGGERTLRKPRIHRVNGLDVAVDDEPDARLEPECDVEFEVDAAGDKNVDCTGLYRFLRRLDPVIEFRFRFELFKGNQQVTRLTRRATRRVRRLIAWRIKRRRRVASCATFRDCRSSVPLER